MRVDKEHIIKKFNVDPDNLVVKTVTHENNPVTKKEIFDNLSKKQKESIEFYHEKGLTWQDLDPRLNRYNSVRYQYLKNCGHLIGEELRVWNCYVEGCEHFQTENIIHYISFGDYKKTICTDKIRADDILQIGQKGSSSTHILDAHPEIASKKLGKMGVKVS